MQVIHTVKCLDDEVSALFDLAKKAGSLELDTTNNTEEKATMTANFVKQFDKLLADYTDQAFKYGYNEGLNNANVKDTAMYKPV